MTVVNGKNMKCDTQVTVIIHLQGRKTFKLTEVLYLPQEVKNILSISRLISKGAMVGDTKNKMTFKKVSVSINLYANKLINESTIFYFKANRYSSEVFPPQEANRNMPEGNKYQYGNDKK